MLKRAGLFAALAFCAGAGTACTFSRSRTNIQDFYARVAEITPGTTTTGQLIQILGSPPNNVIEQANGRVLIYTFGDSKQGGLNLLLVNFERTNIGVDSAIFIVDASGVVQESVVSTNSQDLSYEFWPFGS